MTVDNYYNMISNEVLDSYLKKISCRKYIEIRNDLRDSEHKNLVLDLYAEECVRDGIFPHIDSFMEGVYCLEIQDGNDIMDKDLIKYKLAAWNNRNKVLS